MWVRLSSSRAISRTLSELREEWPFEDATPGGDGAGGGIQAVALA